MLLVIEVSSRAWYLVYGPGLRSYADGDQALATLVRENLDDAFFDGESNQGILSLFEDLETWCKNNLPEVEPVVQSGIPSLQINDKVQVISLWDVFVNIIFTLLVNIWWIILLLVALNVVDRYRFQKYVERHLPDNGDEPTAPFHPILFWHRQGSRWYGRMLDLVMDLENETDEDEAEQSADDAGPTEADQANDADKPADADQPTDQPTHP